MTFNPPNRIIRLLTRFAKIMKPRGIKTYEALLINEKRDIVKNMMQEYAKFDPFSVFEKDGEEDLVLNAMIEVVATGGDAASKEKLSAAVIDIYVTGTKDYPAAFAKEVTSALGNGFTDDRNNDAIKE